MSTYYLVSISEVLLETAKKASKLKELGILLLDKEQPTKLNWEGNILYENEISLTDDWPNIQHLLRPLLNDDEFGAQFYKEEWTPIASQGNDANVSYLDRVNLYKKLLLFPKFWKQLSMESVMPELLEINYLNKVYPILNEASLELLLGQFKKKSEDYLLANSERFSNWSGEVFNKYAVAGLLNSTTKLFRFLNNTATKGEVAILIDVV